MDKISNSSNITVLIILCSLGGVLLALKILRDDLQDFSLHEHKYEVISQLGDDISVARISQRPATVKQTHHYDKKVVNIASKPLIFNQVPIFLVWISMFSIMVGVACGFAIPILLKIIQLFHKYKTSLWQALMILIFCTASVWGLSVRSDQDQIALNAQSIITKFGILLKSTQGLNNMITLTLSIGILSMAGVFTVNFAINRLRSKTGPDFVQSYNELFSTLRFFLVVGSTLVLFSVVVTSLLQQTIESKITITGFPSGKFKIFPAEFVYLYSLSFTIVLVAIYVPVQYHLTSVKDSRIDELLQGEKDKLIVADSAIKNLQLIFTLLSPILGNILVDNLGKLFH